VSAPAVVRDRACPLCGTTAGEPCQDRPAADHLARYLDSYTAGQLTRAYLAKTLGELVVIEPSVVIPAEPEPIAADQLAEVRRVLDQFDWETDDRQYALEKIDGIVSPATA
jgi:hypothetical protein